MSTSHSAPRRLVRLLAVCGLAAAGLAQAGVSSRQVDQPSALPSTETDRLIIKYRDASTAQVRGGQVFSVAKRVDAATLESRSANAQNQAANWGARLSLLRQMGSGAHVYRADKRLSLSQMQALADRIKAADASVEYAEPDRKMFAMLTPNDTSYTQQWDLFEATAGIRAPQAWDLATGTGVVVAVIDTGIRPHADLSGQTVTGYDLINSATIGNDGDARDADPADPGDWVAANECGTGTAAANSSWHGTHVAGTIAAKTNNALGVAGIAFNAKIQPVRVLGKCGGYTSDIADAITWASGGTVSGVPANATPAKVLNLSLGGSGSCGTTTQTAINGARARGSVVVVAAGNSAVNVSNASPANCSGVIAVAALDRYGARAYYSNYGTAVALAAPGGDMRASASNGILSTLNAGTSTPGADNYAYYQGTSMATPHVAGVAALMFSVKPSATPDQIATALRSSARTFAGSCSGCGSGMLDAAAAVTAISSTASYPVVTETEANNSRTTANAVSAPSDVSGSLASSDTSDYFAISLPAGKTLAASLAAASTSADYDLYLYNASGTQIGSSTLGAGSSDSLSYANGGSAAVTVYVRVARYSGSGAYTLNLRW